MRQFAFLALLIASVFAVAALLRSPKSAHNTSTFQESSPASRHASPAPATPSQTSARGESSSQNPVSPAQANTESLETLAANNPEQALALALAEKDETIRDELLQAVLRGWASTRANAAADWAWAHQDTIEQGHGFSAIFNGLKQHPETAQSLVERLSKEHPEEAWSFGRYFIFSLSQSDNFALTTKFAANCNTEFCSDLLTAAYGYWARKQPEQAVHAALAIDDPEKQDISFQAAIDSWAEINPQDLTKAATHFPEGEDRSFAIVKGLRSWIEKDPAGAEAWIAKNKLTPKEAAMSLEE